MVEPSPSALHLLSGGDVRMADIGVKVEQEECGGDGRAKTNSEHHRTLHDWSANQPLETRQLTPPLSRSPSVRSLIGRNGTAFKNNKDSSPPLGNDALTVRFARCDDELLHVLIGGLSRKGAASQAKPQGNEGSRDSRAIRGASQN